MWELGFSDKLEFVRFAFVTGRIIIEMTKRAFDRLKVGDCIVNSKGGNL
jgi:hypothetical protein